ncbi:MAG: hypothetical protein ACM3ZQ_00985 [Bacillota bacterium]
MLNDAELTIEHRREIRQRAEQVLLTHHVPIGRVTRLTAAKAAALLRSLVYESSLTAESYDLDRYTLGGVQVLEDNLVKLVGEDGSERVMGLDGMVVASFPETIGQAPVMFLGTYQRPSQPHLYLRELSLPEWYRPVSMHLAYRQGKTIFFTPDDMKRLMRQEMNGEVHGLNEIISFLTGGIGAVVHVRPCQFTYRYPELSIEKIALWSLDDVYEELDELMQRVNRE